MLTIVWAAAQARPGLTFLAERPSGLGSPAAGRSRRALDGAREESGESTLALYMYLAAYTAESMAAQIKEPQDRIEAVRPPVEALGAKILAGGYPFGEYDVLLILEAPDDTTAASVAMVVAAGGAVSRPGPPGCPAARNGLNLCARRKVLSTGQRG